MYEYVSLENENVVKMLAVIGVLAFVGMAMTPILVDYGDVGFAMMTYGGSKGSAFAAGTGATLLRIGIAIPLVPISPGMVVGKCALML